MPQPLSRTLVPQLACVPALAGWRSVPAAVSNVPTPHSLDGLLLAPVTAHGSRLILPALSDSAAAHRRQALSDDDKAHCLRMAAFGRGWQLLDYFAEFPTHGSYGCAYTAECRVQQAFAEYDQVESLLLQDGRDAPARHDGLLSARLATLALSGDLVAVDQQLSAAMCPLDSSHFHAALGAASRVGVRAAALDSGTYAFASDVFRRMAARGLPATGPTVVWLANAAVTREDTDQVIELLGYVARAAARVSDLELAVCATLSAIARTHPSGSAADVAAFVYKRLELGTVRQDCMSTLRTAFAEAAGADLDASKALAVLRYNRPGGGAWDPNWAVHIAGAHSGSPTDMIHAATLVVRLTGLSVINCPSFFNAILMSLQLHARTHGEIASLVPFVFNTMLANGAQRDSTTYGIVVNDICQAATRQLAAAGAPTTESLSRILRQPLEDLLRVLQIQDRHREEWQRSETNHKAARQAAEANRTTKRLTPTSFSLHRSKPTLSDVGPCASREACVALLQFLQTTASVRGFMSSTLRELEGQLQVAADRMSRDYGRWLGDASSQRDGTASLPPQCKAVVEIAMHDADGEEVSATAEQVHMGISGAMTAAGGPAHVAIDFSTVLGASALPLEDRRRQALQRACASGVVQLSLSASADAAVAEALGNATFNRVVVRGEQSSPAAEAPRLRCRSPLRFATPWRSFQERYVPLITSPFTASMSRRNSALTAAEVAHLESWFGDGKGPELGFR